MSCLKAAPGMGLLVEGLVYEVESRLMIDGGLYEDDQINSSFCM